MYDTCWTRYKDELSACLNTPRTMIIKYLDFPFELDYRVFKIISLSQNNPRAKTFFRIAGIGCGWEWDEVGIYLALEGHTIIYLSWPGTGNSNDPPARYWQTWNFHYEAMLGINFLEALIQQGWISGPVVAMGHSMGCEIAAEMFHLHPRYFQAMIFLAPSGITDLHSVPLPTLKRVGLWMRFGLCGMCHRTEWKLFNLIGRHTPYEQLTQTIPPPRSSFERNRRAQRTSEFFRNVRGMLPHILVNSVGGIPLLGVWGTRDFVVPYHRNHSALNAHKGPVELHTIRRGWHNITLGPRSDQTAAAILKFVEHYLVESVP